MQQAETHWNGGGAFDNLLAFQKTSAKEVSVAQSRLDALSEHQNTRFRNACQRPTKQEITD